MDKTVLITGGAGLVGSECCKLFSEEGWNVISVDNNMRGKIFGKEGSTEDNLSKLIKEYNIEHHEMDIRDEKIILLIEEADAIIHTASQQSHPRSIEIPMGDFQINAYGMIFLFEEVFTDIYEALAPLYR